MPAPLYRRALLTAALLAALLPAAPRLLAADLPATGLPSARPAEVGVRADKLAEIRSRMEALVQAGRISGAVTLVARRGKTVHLEAVGMADRESGRPMRPDTLFWIASQSKSLTAAAVMLLVDEGRLALDERAARYLPELRNVKLADGTAAPGITLRQLLSHTAGLAQPDRKPTDRNVTLAKYTAELLKAPLVFPPGSAYEYGFGLTVAGRVVEVVSGQPFDTFLEQRLCRPLGMKDTTFHPTPAQRARLAKTYRPGETPGSLEPASSPFVTEDPTIRLAPEPSGGLFSTAADMARFYQMILNKGELDGRRLLSPGAVAEMTRPVTAGGKQITYALGWQAAPEKPGGLSGGGHGGAFGTGGHVDPKRELVVVLMIQRMLFDRGGDVRDALHECVAAASAR